MAAINTLLLGTNLRAGVAVSAVLLLALTLTGFLSASYRRARDSQGRRHYEIGQALAKAGNVEGAAEEYRKALLFLPDEPDYRLSLSVALIELGKLDEAETHLQELVEDEPTNGLVNLMLARVSERRSQQRQAVDYFERAVYGYWPRDKMPLRHAARWELVSLLEDQGRRNEAVGELLQLYANAPNDPAERSRIGSLLLKYQATSDAENVFRELTRDDPRYAGGFRGLAQAELDAGDFVEARKNLQHALHLNPADRDSANLLKFAAAVVDLDPTLPRLSVAARLHRSQDLLSRVMKDLDLCPHPAAPAASDSSALGTAAHLLSAPVSDADQRANELQDAAGQLWRDRGHFCSSPTADTRLLDAVMAKVGQ